MRGAFAGNMLLAFITQGPQINVVKEMLSGAQQDRTHDQMRFVNQAFAWANAVSMPSVTK